MRTMLLAASAALALALPLAAAHAQSPAEARAEAALAQLSARYQQIWATLTPAQRQALIQGSLVAGVYEKTVDRESAHEMIKGRAAAGPGAPTPAPAGGLPAFPGAHAVRDALAAGVSETGTTIHWVDAGIDTGEVIAQEKVAVLAGDTEESLHERIKIKERGLIVATIAALLPTLKQDPR